MNKNITDSVVYIGVDDLDIDLFEGQYVVPNGMCYNSYLIKDEKIAVMDTVDSRGTDEWMSKLEAELDGKSPDYLVVLHMEPDHSGSLQVLADKYPDMKIVGNAKTFAFMSQFFDFDIENRKVVVKEGESLSLGSHTLNFVFAPMVHWPEVMVAYESSEKILFAADGFGKFGAIDTDEDWTCEARRYYFNIVGKYGAQVQALLKKLAPYEVSVICPLHGPVLSENLGYYLQKYDIWSSYRPEDEGVLVAYASIHGNTKKAAEKMAEILKEAGSKKVAITDLSRDDMAEAVEDAFRYDRMVFAAASYNGDAFPPMEAFLLHLKGKNYQKRKIALIENGTWAPSAAKSMKAIIDGMKDITLCEKIVTVRSAMKEGDIPALKELAAELLAD